MTPKPKATPWRLYAKMGAVFFGVSLGGPLLINYVSPTEAELFLRYNPDLQKKSLENRFQKQKDFDDFVVRLKEYSKGDRPIWEEAAEADKRKKEAMSSETRKLVEEMEKRKREMRKEGMEGMPGGSSQLEG